MSNYSKLKKYKNLLKRGYIKNNYISHQNIFEGLDKVFQVSRINNFKQNLYIILYKLLNYICSLKIRNNKLSTIHYWIPLSNSKDVIDHRSKYFLSTKLIKNQINLVRTNSLFSSLYLLFSVPNIIFLNGFQKINSFHEIKMLNNLKNKCLFYEKNERTISKNLQKFLVKKNIKKLICIDDYRIIQTLLDASIQLKIRTVAYQHGRFHEFQLGLKGKTFDEYVVWSKFFKKKIIKINKNYNQKKIKILNFRFKKPKLRKNGDNLLYLCEQKIPINQIIKDIRLICKHIPEKKIFIRLRSSINYPKNFTNFLNSKMIIILKENSFYDAVNNNNIKYLIAYYSTALLEASLYNVYPIMLTNNNFYLKDYLKEKTVFELQQLGRFKILKNQLNTKKGKNKLEKIKRKIWY